MKKSEQLARLLARLNSGENPTGVKREAQEFLSTLSAQDLSLAEQKLIDAGLKPEDLRHLCSAHMEMLGNETENFKQSLAPGHVVHTLVSEHEMILGFLDKLEKVNQKIQSMPEFDAGNEAFGLLRHIADHLEGAEPHHQREEEVLFPVMEAQGVFGPTEVMRLEHKDLRRYKKELMELSKNISAKNFVSAKKRLDAVSKFIIMMLRDHIFKENNILYPTSIQVIHDPAKWSEMKARCDKIGYCCFTPGK